MLCFRIKLVPGGSGGDIFILFFFGHVNSFYYERNPMVQNEKHMGFSMLNIDILALKTDIFVCQSAILNQITCDFTYKQ